MNVCIFYRGEKRGHSRRPHGNRPGDSRRSRKHAFGALARHCATAFSLLLLLGAACQAADEERDLLSAAQDYKLGNAMISKVLEQHEGLTFAERDYERWYNGNNKTRLPVVVVAVRSTLSTKRWESVPYQCLFSRERVTSVELRDKDITVILTGVQAELLYLRVAETTVYVSTSLREMAVDPPTMSRLKILCFMGKILWDLDVKQVGALERAMARDSRPPKQPSRRPQAPSPSPDRGEKGSEDREATIDSQKTPLTAEEAWNEMIALYREGHCLEVWTKLAAFQQQFLDSPHINQIPHIQTRLGAEVEGAIDALATHLERSYREERWSEFPAGLERFAAVALPNRWTPTLEQLRMMADILDARAEQRSRELGTLKSMSNDKDIVTLLRTLDDILELNPRHQESRELQERARKRAKQLAEHFLSKAEAVSPQTASYKVNLRKVIMLDPDGELGNRAKMLLNKLQAAGSTS